MVHATQILERATIGPVSGTVVVLGGVLFHGGWIVFALITYRDEIASRKQRGNLISMG